MNSQKYYASEKRKMINEKDLNDVNFRILRGERADKKRKIQRSNRSNTSREEWKSVI